ncbi:hypothetical protein QZH41_012274 [Actinostola sp. cb2023]|nr:hypothetical protein QZH41_012274 [Actinostola sp. cb2023]
MSGSDSHCGYLLGFSFSLFFFAVPIEKLLGLSKFQMRRLMSTTSVLSPAAKKASPEEEVIGVILERYRQEARPVMNPNSTINVTFGMELVQLVNVNDRHQMITTNVWVRQKWENQLLTWDPEKFNGIKQVRLHASKVWIPDIVLYNSAGNEFSGGTEKYKTPVIVNHDGTNKWYSPASFTSTCKIDVTFFPFDIQTCSLKFGSWTYEINDLDMTPENASMTSMYIESAEWDLNDAYKIRQAKKYPCCENALVDITSFITIKRKPLFYLFNLVVPCMIILSMILLGFFLPPESGKTLSHEERLLNDLIHDYNRDAYPVPAADAHRNLSRVRFGLELVQLVNVGFIILSVQHWYNYLLRWDPAKYAGIERVRIEPSKIWIPDIVLYNSADSEFSGGLEKYKTRVIMKYNGGQTWYSPASFRSTCQIDVTFFPFDQQACFMKFGSWTFETVDLDIFVDNAPLHSKQYVKSAEWDLIGASRTRNVEYYACCKHPFSDVTIEFVFRRKPLFYMFNLIVPCMIITGMVLLGFFVPPESGERITLNITVLLAMAVFLQLAAQNLPRNSENVPVLGIFYITVMVEVALSLIATCYVLHIHHMSSGIALVPVPKWVQHFILGWLSKMLGVQKPISEDRYDISSKKNFKRMSVMKKDLERRLGDGKRRLIGNGLDASHDSNDEIELTETNAISQCSCQNIENPLGKLSESTIQSVMVLAEDVKHRRMIEKNKEQWRHLAMVLDRLFFWLFVIMMILSSTVILRTPGRPY